MTLNPLFSLLDPSSTLTAAQAEDFIAAMTTLTTFPPELLDLLFRQKDASGSVISLWLCGNTILNTKLANGGVTELRLKDRRWWPSSRWPKMLSALRHLRVLHISLPHGLLMSAGDLAVQLRALPPTIERLKIESKNSTSCLERDSSMSEVFKNERGVSRLWPIGEYLPRLQELTLLNKGSPPSFRDSDFAALPDTLISFVCKNNSSSLDDMSIDPAALPRGLAKLELFGLGFFNARLLARLPPNLTWFDSEPLANEDIPYLPRNLIKRPGEQMDMALDESSIASLPPSSRVVTGFPQSFRANWVKEWSALPRGLTELNLLINRMPEDWMLTNSMLAVFPRTLTKLHLKLPIDWEDLESTRDDTNWPKNLTVLSIAGSTFDPTGANSKWDSWTMASHALPPWLQHLTLKEFDLPLFDETAWPLLPPALRELKIHTPIDIPEVALEFRANPSALPPATLTIIDFGVNLVSELSVAFLPRTLTKLVIALFDDPISPTFASEIPPLEMKHLRFLSLSYARYHWLTKLSNTALETLILENMVDCPTLPSPAPTPTNESVDAISNPSSSTLAIVAIRLEEEDVLGDCAAASLPRTLRELSIERVRISGKSAISKFPPNLEIFNMPQPLSNIDAHEFELPSGAINELPMSLRRGSIIVGRVEQSDLKTMPLRTKLRVLRITATSVHLDHHQPIDSVCPPFGYIEFMGNGSYEARKELSELYAARTRRSELLS